jgi:hypothetical protein
LATKNNNKKKSLNFSRVNLEVLRELSVGEELLSADDALERADRRRPVGHGQLRLLLRTENVVFDHTLEQTKLPTYIPGNKPTSKVGLKKL